MKIRLDVGYHEVSFPLFFGGLNLERTMFLGDKGTALSSLFAIIEDVNLLYYERTQTTLTVAHDGMLYSTSETRNIELGSSRMSPTPC